MKRIQFSLWVICVLCILLHLDLVGQVNPDRILRNTRSKTEHQVEKRIENRIDEAVDKTLDEIEESIDGKGKTEAVVKQMVAMGISADRLTSTGHGQSQPIAPNDTQENKAHNRRVEFVKI